MRVPQARIEESLQALLDAGFLQVVGSEYPLIALTPEGGEALRGETDLVVHAPAAAARPAASELGAGADPALLGELKAWRSGLARERGVPPYVIFPDKTLVALAALRPYEEAALLAVPGIGPKKSVEFGEALLEIISTHR